MLMIELIMRCYSSIFKIQCEKYIKQSFQFLSMNKQIAEMLVTLQNSKQSEIPPYAQEGIEVIKAELKRLNEQIKIHTAKSKKNDQSKTPEEKAFEKAKIALLFDQVYRIKRFLLIYSDFRCDRIEDQFWAYGGDLKHSEKGNISAAEKEYLSSYKSLVMDYIEETKVELTIDLEPPLEIQVEYRMLEDCGEILDDFGHMVKLEKNSCGFMKKRLIQIYAKQGYATIKKR